ncbi:ImuA family protein [Sagittula sp. SSi028]|uniref:ImuA family protein n=1 Tax=Sagittula sp. SSi028 TaxID=3400636 RepID=UPI003AF6D4A0
MALAEGVSFALARVHELCGGARRTLALQLAARVLGHRPAPVIWILPEHVSTRLTATGVQPIVAAGQLLFVRPVRAQDVLWAMEEALKDGAAPVVVAEMDSPPGMTPVRRLHLAAEAGARVEGAAPLGLILTPDRGGAPGIETRWSCDPAHMSEATGWRLERLRARMLPPKVWLWTGHALRDWPFGAGPLPVQAGHSPALRNVTAQPGAPYRYLPRRLPATKQDGTPVDARQSC